MLKTIDVEVEIDLDDVIKDLDDVELAQSGLSRSMPLSGAPRTMLDTIRLACARRDLDAVLDQVELFARDHGVILDTTRVRPSHRAAA